MKFVPKITSRINPAKLGIEVENEEQEALEAAKDDDGVVDLAKVYDIPVSNSATESNKTIVKYLERDGIEYTEKQYQKEYRLKAAHQIMINGGTTAQIAQALNVTLNEAKNLKKELVSRQISGIKNLSVEEEVAKAYMFYDHIAAKALQLSTKGGDKQLRTQVEALKVALQAQTDKQKFLHNAGMYDNGFRNGNTNTHVDSANAIRDMVTSVLSGDSYEAVPDEEEIDDGVSVL